MADIGNDAARGAAAGVTWGVVTGLGAVSGATIGGTVGCTHGLFAAESPVVDVTYCKRCIQLLEFANFVILYKRLHHAYARAVDIKMIRTMLQKKSSAD
jgi:hypothetical protein